MGVSGDDEAGDGGLVHANDEEDLVEGDAADAEGGDDGEFAPGPGFGPAGVMALAPEVDGEHQEGGKDGAKRPDHQGGEEAERDFGYDEIDAPDEGHQADESVDKGARVGHVDEQSWRRTRTDWRKSRSRG